MATVLPSPAAELSPLPFHPACEALPEMSPAEFRELVDSIGNQGLLEPITLHEGAILDGRNRYRACAEAGVAPRFVEWAGEGGHPVLFVIARNVSRRHLAPSQRAMLVVDRLLPLLEEEASRRKAQAPGESRGAKSLPAASPEQNGEAREQAAAAAQVSPRTVSDAKRIAQEDSRDLPDLRGRDPGQHRGDAGRASHGSVIMTTFKDRARRQRILRMRDLLRERAILLGLPLAETLDRMTQAERQQLDARANIDRGFDPASADTWEQLRTACIRYDEVTEAIDRATEDSPESDLDRALR